MNKTNIVILLKKECSIHYLKQIAHIAKKSILMREKPIKNM